MNLNEIFARINKVSAGCIIVKEFDGIPHVLMVHATGSSWKNKKMGFPKGHVNFGEKVEEAALRETQEETGIKCQIIKYVGRVTKKDKSVHGFLAKYTSGKLSDKKAINIQKDEIDYAAFIPFEEAIEICYNYMKSLLIKAKKLYKNK